jgi:hypothetical protein
MVFNLAWFRMYGIEVCDKNRGKGREIEGIGCEMLKRKEKVDESVALAESEASMAVAVIFEGFEIEIDGVEGCEAKI